MTTTHSSSTHSVEEVIENLCPRMMKDWCGQLVMEMV